MSGAVPRKFILIVDDDERILRALRLVLRNDFEVVLAVCFADARIALDSSQVDVVLCDQRMPDGLGTEFLSLLAKERPHIVRVLHTGSPPEEANTLIATGAIHRMLVKPVSVTEMRATIDALLKAAAES